MYVASTVEKKARTLNNPGDFLDEMSVSRPGSRDVSVYIFRVAARFVSVNELPFGFERRRVKGVEGITRGRDTRGLFLPFPPSSGN